MALFSLILINLSLLYVCTTTGVSIVTRLEKYNSSCLHLCWILRRTIAVNVTSIQATLKAFKYESNELTK
jgi:hypothetical protein